MKVFATVGTVDTSRPSQMKATDFYEKYFVTRINFAFPYYINYR